MWMEQISQGAGLGHPCRCQIILQGWVLQCQGFGKWVGAAAGGGWSYSDGAGRERPLDVTSEHHLKLKVELKTCILPAASVLGGTC